MRADFVANASHELRTPLASLTRLHRDAAGPGDERPGGARAVPRRSCASRAWRMARLIDDLLSLSRIELQRPRPARGEPVDLVGAARRSTDALHPLARDSGVQITLSLPRRRRSRSPATGTSCCRCSRTSSRTPSSTGSPAARVESTARRERGRGEPELLSVSVRDYGAGHRRRAPAAPDRAVLPRRRCDEPREGRHRAGPGHRQAHRHPPSRPADDRERAREGGALHRRSSIPPKRRPGHEINRRRPEKAIFFNMLLCHTPVMGKS